MKGIAQGFLIVFGFFFIVLFMFPAMGKTSTTVETGVDTALTTSQSTDANSSADGEQTFEVKDTGNSTNTNTININNGGDGTNSGGGFVIKAEMRCSDEMMKDPAQAETCFNGVEVKAREIVKNDDLLFFAIIGMGVICIALFGLMIMLAPR